MHEIHDSHIIECILRMFVAIWKEHCKGWQHVRISSLGNSVESSMHQSVQEADGPLARVPGTTQFICASHTARAQEKRARQRAEADLGIRNEQLSEHFVSMQKACGILRSQCVDMAQQESDLTCCGEGSSF